MWTQLRLIGRLTVGVAFVAFVAGVPDAGGQAPAGGGANPPAQTAQRTPVQNPVKDGWMTFKIHSAYVPEDLLEGSDIDVTSMFIRPRPESILEAASELR